MLSYTVCNILRQCIYMYLYVMLGIVGCRAEDSSTAGSGR